jgi:hypothetical protein
MFSDRFIKIVSDFEIIFLGHCLVAFGFKEACILLIGTPIVFSITQNELRMKKKMGFQTRKA